MSSQQHNESPGEAFIPYQRADLLEMCLAGDELSACDQAAFRRFSELFAAFTHFEFHKEIEQFKRHYWSYDPDLETLQSEQSDAAESTDADQVYKAFEFLADRSNYQEVTMEELELSFHDSTLIDLNTSVNLDDFEKVICYARGTATTQETVSRTFRHVTIEAEVWRRVLLLLHFKGIDNFTTDKHRKKGTEPDLTFRPGKIYSYYYKDVPKADLELLFPNVGISMTPKDKILLSVPALGAGIAAAVKIVGKLTLILAAIAITFGWVWLKELLNIDESVDVKSFAALSAFFTVVLTLTMLAFKQWDKYKNKRNNFLKVVSENLFFRNLATNQSVFNRMLDSAEEEECKEAMLVYYHLLANCDTPMTAQQLDAHIEAWMKREFSTVIDFDIDGPIANLSRIRGCNAAGKGDVALLAKDSEGYLRTPPLEDACYILDYLWDKAYEFHTPT